MSKGKIVAIIPARMASSRFPGKPLAKILYLPMIEHVRRRTLLSSVVDEVYVATCDEEIKKTVHRFGGKAIMTKNTHKRCTDRVEEAAGQIEADIVVIVQGDEPLFLPDVIEKLVEPIQSNDNVYCTNLLSVIRYRGDLRDIDIVKAVVDNCDNIMYYSRSSIPYFRVGKKCTLYRQTGISAFTKEFLSKFTNMVPTTLETVESVDFLRILQHGYKIKGVIFSQKMLGVDRKEDIVKIEDVLQKDPVQKRYYEQIMKL